MNKDLKIITEVNRLVHILTDISDGIYQTPKFQRDFVWSKSNILQLFDSIKNGYPIGSILLWKPKTDVFEKTNKLGPYIIPDNKDSFWFILDGYQRLSSIFGCLFDPDSNKLDFDEIVWSNKFNIWYDLSTEEFFIPRQNVSTSPYQVALYKLINTKEAFKFQTNLVNNNISDEMVDIYMERYSELGTTFIDYTLPTINIEGGNITEAVEIFSRINSRGMDISPDWMISALTYNKDKNFRLGSLIDDLLNSLEAYNFHKLPKARDIILKCIMNSFGKSYLDQSNNLEQLAKRQDFIKISKKTISSIEKAVQFLYQDLLVLDSKYLPYLPQLIFITDFFNTLENPSERQLYDLKRWFWITSYSNYFTIYTISKQRKAYYQFRKYLNNETSEIVYYDTPNIPFQTLDFPVKNFSGSARYNCLCLFMLNYSKNFQTIERKSADCLYELKLINSKAHTNIPENTILYFNNSDDNVLTKKSIIENRLINNDNYFIDENVTNHLKSNKNNKAIKFRKNCIIENEQKFVTNLGLIYK